MKKHKLILIFLVVIIGASFFYNIEKTNAEALKTEDEIQKLLRQPQPQIKIPGLSFSKPTVTDGNIENATIGEYIQTIYRFGIATVSLFATIMIMIGGLQWILSAGSPEKITQAKKLVTQAFLGVGLAVFSYTILYLINPSLVEFKSLSVKVIQEIDIDTAILEGKTLYEGKSRSASDPIFDDIFKSFGNCINVDYRVLKAFALKESGLNHTIVNKSGFTGLFQTNQKFCKSALKKYPEWSSKCDDLTNPNVSTAVGSVMLQNALKKLTKCGDSLNPVDKGSLIYLNHNSGGGALNYILARDACQGGEKIKDGIVNFWNQHKGGAYNGQGLGEKRYAFSIGVGELIKNLGVTDFNNTFGNGALACPFSGAVPTYDESTILNFGSPTINCSKSFDGKKILTIGSSSIDGPNNIDDFIKSNCPNTLLVTEEGESGSRVNFAQQKIDSINNLSHYDFVLFYTGTNDIASGKTPEQTHQELKNLYQSAKTKSPGTKIISLSVSPYGRSGEKPKKLHELLKADPGASDYFVPWYEYSVDPSNIDILKPAFNKGVGKDQIHPNTAGYNFVAKLIIYEVSQK